VYGSEPNYYAVEYAQTNFGLEIVHGYFDAMLFNKKFDIVIAEQVLEHVPEPRKFMSDIFSVLSPKGILYLSVPGIPGGIFMIGYSILFPRAPQSIFRDNDVHINHFSHKGIIKLIKENCGRLHSRIAVGHYFILAN
jgi:SAM-dependent methyltransferase